MEPEDLSKPSLELIQEQALTLLDLIHRRHPDPDPEQPKLVTHVLRDLLEVLREAGDVPVLLNRVGDFDYRRQYAGTRYDSVTKRESFEDSAVRVYGMQDDEGRELTPGGLAFEGLAPVAVMH